jgi:hypothetical protein
MASSLQGSSSAIVVLAAMVFIFSRTEMLLKPLPPKIAVVVALTDVHQKYVSVPRRSGNWPKHPRFRHKAALSRNTTV